MGPKRQRKRSKLPQGESAGDACTEEDQTTKPNMKQATFANDIHITLGGSPTEYRIRYQQISGNKAGWYIYQQNAETYWHVWRIEPTLAEAFRAVGATF